MIWHCEKLILSAGSTLECELPAPVTLDEKCIPPRDCRLSEGTLMESVGMYRVATKPDWREISWGDWVPTRFGVAVHHSILEQNDTEIAKDTVFESEREELSG
jgi:hypothetical protein